MNSAASEPETVEAECRWLAAGINTPCDGCNADRYAAGVALDLIGTPVGGQMPSEADWQQLHNT